MSQSNKPINYRFRKNVTVDDMALGNAKRTSNSKPINAVGDAAAKDPRNRAGEARGNVIDLTNDASAVTQSPTVSGRDGSEATTVRTPEDEAASVKSANNDAFFAALKKSLVLEQSPSMSRAVPSSGNETVFIHTTYPDGTAVRTPQVYATPTAEEAKAIRRKTEQLMANRHATMINGRGRIQPNATVARSLQPKTTIAGPLQPFNNSMIAERAAIDAVAKGYMVNTLLNAPASLQLGSNVSSTKLRNLAPKVSGDKDVVLDNLDGDSTAAIKKLKDLTSSVERIIETSKASQGANISAIPELVTPEYDIAAAMNLAGDTDTDRLPAYPLSLHSLPPNNRKVKNLGLIKPKTAANKRDTPAKPIFDSSNLASKLLENCAATGGNESMTPPSVTKNPGGNESTAPPSISKKHVLSSPKAEPTELAKKRSTGDVPTPASLQPRPPTVIGSDVAKSAAKTRGATEPNTKRSKSAPQTRPDPSSSTAVVKPLPAPLSPTVIAAILAAEPPDRPAIFLGDDLAIARGEDPLAARDPNDPHARFAKPQRLLYDMFPHSPVPESWIEAEEPDRMLYLLDEEKRDWQDIRYEWNNLTGRWPGVEELKERLVKFRENMLVLEDGDAQRLLTAVRDLDVDYRARKWVFIAENIRRMGGANYPISFLQKKHKELAFQEVLAQGDALVAERGAAAMATPSASAAGNVVDSDGV